MWKKNNVSSKSNDNVLLDQALKSARQQEKENNAALVLIDDFFTESSTRSEKPSEFLRCMYQLSENKNINILSDTLHLSSHRKELLHKTIRSAVYHAQEHFKSCCAEENKLKTRMDCQTYVTQCVIEYTSIIKSNSSHLDSREVDHLSSVFNQIYQKTFNQLYDFKI